MIRVVRTLLCLLLSLMAACGGGGGGDPAGAAPTPTPSPTSPPPQVSSDKSLLSFSVAGVDATIDQTAHTVSVTVPFGTDLTTLVASFTTNGSQVRVNGTAQSSGVSPNDFSSTVDYVVVAADGSSATYRVRVSAALNSAKAITSFSILGAMAVIDEAAHTISVTLPNGTSVTSLVAGFTAPGATVRVGNVVQTSRVTANNFSRAVTYTVTAADGSTASYVVTVTVAASSEKAFRSFVVSSATLGPTPGTIDDAARTIVVNLPSGTSRSALLATFTFYGTRVSVGGVTQQSGTSTQDFSSPLVYTITAADGSTVDYTVTVIVAAPTPPTVVSRSPSGTATSPAPLIIATFNKALDSSTCTTATMSVSGTSGSVRCSGASIIFTPSRTLTLSTTHTATVTTALKDVDGLSPAAPVVWSFITRSEYEAPYVRSISNGPEGLRVEFNEAVVESSVNATNLALAPTASGSFAVSGALAVFRPAAPLAKDTDYTLTVSGVADVVGNAMSTAQSWSFHTDPGEVTPVEYYSGLSCVGITDTFSVQGVNNTGRTQDIQICVHNAARGQPDCTTFPAIAAGASTPVTRNPYSGAWASSAGVCYSNGQYTITWTPSGGSPSAGRTRTHTSPVWTPTAPKADPCSLGGAVRPANCVPQLSITLNSGSPTSPVSSTLPAGTPISAPTAPDADGCFVPQRDPECLVVDSAAFSALTPGMVTVRFRNQCGARVYANFCLKHVDGSWDCGAGGVPAGGTTPWWAYNSTGQYIYQYTGSANWQNDWICGARDPNWSTRFP